MVKGQTSHLNRRLPSTFAFNDHHVTTKPRKGKCSLHRFKIANKWMMFQKVAKLESKQGVAEEKEHEHQDLLGRANQAQIGFAIMDVFDTMELRFGWYNPRMLNKREVRALKECFNTEGIRQYDTENAIPIIVKHDYFEVQSVVKDAWSGGTEILEIVWTENAYQAGVICVT